MVSTAPMSKRTRMIAIATVVGFVLVGAALLTTGPGGLAPFGLGARGDSTTATTAAGVVGAQTTGSVVGTSTMIGQDRTQQSRPTSRAADLAVPAAPGAELASVTSPPPQTLAMLNKDTATAGSTYSVTFAVYGYGPTSGTIKTAVLSITKSVAEGTPAHPFNFTGRNVLARLDPKAAEALRSGGTYSGTITLRDSGDTLIPWLSDVGPAR